MNRDELLNDQETAIRTALDGRQAQIWTSMPAIVTSVDWSTMTLECQPAIQGVITLSDSSEQYVNLPLLLDVPIVFPSSGGFTLTFPIQVGSEVLVSIASRCIDSWFQSGGIGVPMESRMHDLSDGFAFPGPKSLPNVIPSISSTVAQLRNDAGTLILEFTSTGFKITGDLAVTGSIVATGEVTGNSIALSTHTHPVTTAPGTTGAPL